MANNGDYYLHIAVARGNQKHERHIKYACDRYNKILLIVNSYNMNIDDIPESLIQYVIIHDNLKLIHDICSTGIAIPEPEFNNKIEWKLP